MSTNGRRMRGQRFLLISDLERLFVYRGLRKCPALFAKMFFRISQPLIRLGLRRATFPPRGRLFDFAVRYSGIDKGTRAPEWKALFRQKFVSASKEKATRRPREEASEHKSMNDPHVISPLLSCKTHQEIRRVSVDISYLP